MENCIGQLQMERDLVDSPRRRFGSSGHAASDKDPEFLMHSQMTGSHLNVGSSLKLSLLV